VQLLGWLVCALGVGLSPSPRSPRLGACKRRWRPLSSSFRHSVAAFAPVTPAGIDVTSGAVALVLHERGADTSTALAAGIALNAVETAAGLALGIASGLLLAFPSPAARRWTLMSAGACLSAVFLGVGNFVELA
jgi:hypothetical protein